MVAGVSGAADAPRWADPAKTLRVMFPIAETGFDPQATQDYYSSHVQRAILDPLYRVIARYRYRWFGHYDECRLPSEPERRRFLP